MVALGTILNHFANWAAQTDQMVAFKTILDHFATWAAQTVQIVAFGTILDHFATWAAQTVQVILLAPRWMISPTGQPGRSNYSLLVPL